MSQAVAAQHHGYRDLFGHHRHKHKKKFNPGLFDLALDKTQEERETIASKMVERAAELFSAGSREKETLYVEADRYENCRKRRGIYRCEQCESKYSFHRFCHSRICETCGRIFKQHLESQLVPIIEGLLESRRRGYVLSSLTLTVQKARFGDRMPNRADIKRLHEESAKMLKLFYGKYIVKMRANGKLYEPAPRWIYRKDPVTGRRKKLRRREPRIVIGRKNKQREDYRYWKGAGAIACLEVGKDNNNLHLHAICYGPIHDITRFRESWARITGDSSNIKLIPIGNRTVRDNSGKPVELSVRHSVGHLLKYITKPPVSESYSRIAEFAIMLKGSRRLKTSGIFYDRIRMTRAVKEEKDCLVCAGRLRFLTELNSGDGGDAIDYFAASKDSSLIAGRWKFKDYDWVDPAHCHLLPS